MVDMKFKPFQDKITDFYFRKEWQENIDNRTDKIFGRTRPWLDANFYYRLDKWMKQEYGVEYRRFKDDPENIYFDNPEDATRFVLIWS